MIRVLHFSDVHVQEPVTTMPVHEFISKRALAAVNLWVSRGRLFREVPQKLEALAQFAMREGVNVAMCTGDYTALGTDVSAGGMPDRVKCLHVAVAHALAAGRGVNPFGDEALEELGDWWAAGPCVTPEG